jgi:Mycothiol maleylpyruvate isomerase N-terminal domain
MAVDRSFVTQNDAERARLEKLVGRLSDGDLQRPLAAGWTVAGVLAHLAFWDQRTFILLDRWQRDGVAPPADDQGNVDWINDSAKPMFLALPPRRTVELALAIAEATDRKVASLSDDLVRRIAETGAPVSLVRATHRREHLDEIERALKG